MRPAVAVLAILILEACAESEQSRLERGMAYARSQFVAAGRNPAAAMALQSNVEMGGTLSTYLYAGMADNADLPRYQDDRPPGPWGIALRALGGDTVLIEGYGQSLDRPVLAETLVVRLAPMR